MAGGTHLELEERERLAALKAEGLSLRAIARALGRAASTVSRELRRNALPRGGYLPVHAEGCYRERRQRPAVLERDERLGRFVRERLLEGWTPEQIAGWLKRGEERGLRPVSLETIYAFIHRPGQRGEKLWKLLPRGRARRGRRRGRRPRSTIAGRRSIHDRPADVQERKDPGHWEGDLLICKRTRPVLVLEERKTRFVLAARLAGKSAAETSGGAAWRPSSAARARGCGPRSPSTTTPRSPALARLSGRRDRRRGGHAATAGSRCGTGPASGSRRLPWHADEMVEACRWQACEAELLQAVDRLRLVDHAGTLQGSARSTS